MSDASELPPLLDVLIGLPVDPPSLYFDLEGVNLGRAGSISLLLLHVIPRFATYIIDIHALGAAAFSTENNTGTSLKTILENPDIPKGIFDIRNDSDALYSHYGIRVNGIIDLQLLELATRDYSKDFLAGLAKCIQNNKSLSDSAKKTWHLAKEIGKRLFDPQLGGRYEVFNERPLKPEILIYCRQDVELLPSLWELYSCKLRVPTNGFWRSMVKEATKDRIKLSRSAGYDGQAKSKACGPWDSYIIEDSREAWNDDVIMCGVNEGMVLDQNDHWADFPQKVCNKSSVFTLAARL
ncbi:uncharacterized protein N7511_003512 [Penicillium nucicola]|uniref:uncharacterized protein n=1 Tax=Penicillium nucicola TaxID=1850975 RepID=UPI002544DD1B|nr:uncharacterized protein N7511_003512 [Penicillium nucicola]KAJ5771461.1 hypothetical protein N7511_003512 [Penicillium nucicola]